MLIVRSVANTARARDRCEPGGRHPLEPAAARAERPRLTIHLDGMANFIVVVDENEERRRRFIARVRPMLPPLDGLDIGDATLGPFAACWAARPAAPTSVHTGADVAAVVWGDALPREGPSVRASDLAGLWSDDRERTPPAFDGFYAAVRFHARQGLTVGGDVLGLFPVYYGVRRGVIVVGSSPELFRHHPLFPVELDREGLIGLLVTHAPFAGRTLLAGLSRLEPGRALLWSAAGGCHEIVQHAPEVITLVVFAILAVWYRESRFAGTRWLASS
jgi:asparagine synthase (glutamine-hydrolysing)